METEEQSFSNFFALQYFHVRWNTTRIKQKKGGNKNEEKEENVNLKRKIKTERKKEMSVINKNESKNKTII